MIAQIIDQPSASARHDAVAADLTFITPTNANPRILSAAYTGGEAQNLFGVEDHRVLVTDLRPAADLFTLDHEGFAFRRSTSAVRDFYDDDQIERIYHTEIEGLLRRELGADRVVIFDVTRRSDRKSGAPNKDGARGPAGRIHVDYTAKSGPVRFSDLVGAAEAERLERAGARVIQVNVWRPIKGPVERSPLALADASTIQQSDLIATDHVFPDRIGEIYHLTHHPTQRWYYASQMMPDELFLIKGWDSMNDGRARFTPHTAFNPAVVQDGAPARESIEVRTFVVIE